MSSVKLLLLFRIVVHITNFVILLFLCSSVDFCNLIECVIKNSRFRAHQVLYLQAYICLTSGRRTEDIGKLLKFAIESYWDRIH